MDIPFETLIHHLHAASSGALATHSVEVSGYPFATLLPFVSDEYHRPVFLVSMLAEHTRNIVADRRASLLVAQIDELPVLAAARLTIAGDMERIDAPGALLQRYLRHHPDAEHYVALGDFAFFRLVPRRARYIAGFARMGWIEGEEWSQAAVLPLTDELALCEELTACQPAGMRILGLDCYGIDIERGGRRERLRFPGPLGQTREIGETARSLIAALD